MKIKKGDTVLIIIGKDIGRKGKVLRALPRNKKIVIEGLNLRKKHMKPKKSGEKGQIISFPAPISISNVKIICPKCSKAARIGKKRVCKKCNQEL